jgi:hypothetical protein
VIGAHCIDCFRWPMPPGGHPRPRAVIRMRSGTPGHKQVSLPIRIVLLAPPVFGANLISPLVPKNALAFSLTQGMFLVCSKQAPEDATGKPTAICGNHQDMSVLGQRHCGGRMWLDPSPEGGGWRAKRAGWEVNRKDLAHWATPTRPCWLRTAKPTRSTSPKGEVFQVCCPVICDSPPPKGEGWPSEARPGGGLCSASSISSPTRPPTQASLRSLRELGCVRPPSPSGRDAVCSPASACAWEIKQGSNHQEGNVAQSQIEYTATCNFDPRFWQNEPNSLISERGRLCAPSSDMRRDALTASWL